MGGNLSNREPFKLISQDLSRVSGVVHLHGSIKVSEKPGAQILKRAAETRRYNRMMKQLEAEKASKRGLLSRVMGFFRLK